LTTTGKCLRLEGYRVNMKKLFLIATLLVVALATFLYWGHLGSDDHESFIFNSKGSSTKTKHIKTVSYNIAYGRGAIDDKGDLRSKEAIEGYLDKISDLLIVSDANIVLLQEVDLASKRTHYINQAEYIAKRSGYPSYACVTTWIKNYIPYPYWPPSQHYGRMKSGQCILSKFPIASNKRIELPQRTDKPFFYTAFYLDRAIQVAEIMVGKATLHVFNVHLVAYDFNNKLEQAEILASHINNLLADDKIIVGGDFNALPPNATMKKDFPDKPDGPWKDVSDDMTMNEFMTLSPRLQEVIRKAIPESETFTYPGNAPNRRLDYIFCSKNLKIKKGKILQSGPISDHLPVYATISH